MAFAQNNALRITEPAPAKDGTIVTNEPAIILKGTLSWTRGDTRVLWESNRGFSDLAAVNLREDGKTISWRTASPVPLRPGINHLRIKALGQDGAATFVNIFYTPQTQAKAPALRTAIIHGKQIAYEVKNGLAIYQGDMVLGKAADIAALSVPPSVNSSKGLRPKSLTIAPNFFSSTGLWPIVNGVARVPYTITNVNTANTNNINAAIAEANTQLTGVLQWEPATASDANYVNFDFDPTNLTGACEAYAGMVGGPQTIGGSVDCTTTTILHEMGHAMGLYHEQSRADRDTYVNYMEQNIDKPNHGNFDIIGSASVDSGLYNYASIMEYGPFSFNRDGVSPTLETIPPGMVLGTSTPKYTTGDLDGIMRLYAHAPSSITVDTNPTGLQVVVDSTPCTAPCVFTSWTTGSQHTLSVPLDANSQTLQTLSGQSYIFGRWNAGSSNVQTVTVTNSLGNGTLLSPSTSPAITNYLASFIPVHPYSPVVSPTGDGAISASPSPSSLIINGTATNYYFDRQLVTFTVNPNAGFNFDFWANVPLFNLYSNPFTLYITSNFDSSYNGNPTTAVLVTDPVTTITAASPDIGATGTFPGFAFGVVDGNGNTSTSYTPANFDASQNGSGFASGKTLTFSSAATQSPVTTNISYQFNNWSGAGTPNSDSLSVVVPASGQSKSTANFTPSFRSIVETYLFCPDGSNDNELSVTSSPAGTNVNSEDTSDGDLDAFFTAGTVTFTASTGPTGLGFAGWSLDLAAGGTTNPFPFSLTGQVLGTANFNIIGAAPLTITSVSPVTATTGAVNLTVTGTGFSTNASSLYTYYVDPVTGYYQYRANTPTPAGSSTETVVQLNAGDVSTAGYYQIVVLNAVASGCNPSVAYTFAVANAAGPPVLGITKSHTGNFNAGQQNAQYTIQVSNKGTGPTVDPVTMTEDVPSGETLVSMAGSGWTCTLSTASCTRSDSLGAGLSYGAITVTVNVASNATSPQVNSATVSGGGASSATATDSTTIVFPASVVSLTPSSGTGLTQTFTGVYADPNGISDLSNVYLLFNTAISGANACYVSYNPATNLMYLYSNAGTSVLSPSITPGSSESVSNSQCTLNGTGSSFSTAGNNLTLNVALTFSSTFTGLKNVYMEAQGRTSNSGWVKEGTWTPGTAGPPTVVSLAPSSGTGLTQTFTLVYSDPKGISDLSYVYVLFNTAVTGSNACYVSYNPGTNLMYLYSNAGTGVLSPSITPGSSTSVSNSQCTLKGTGSSFSTSGINLTLNVALTFSGTFTGSKNVYLEAQGKTQNSGWVKEGTWTPGAPAPPTVVSLSPTSGTGLTQTFTGVYSDPAGISDLNTVYLLFNTAVTGSNGCYVSYIPATNLMYLYSNAGTSVLSPSITPGSTTSVSNSQCTLNGTGSSFSTSGNNLTLHVALNFASTFTGLKNVYLEAHGETQNSGWQKEGTWTPATAGPPTVVSVTPSSGTGMTQTFTTVYSDPNGLPDLNYVYAIINGTLTGANACYLNYNPATNLMSLYTNAGTGVLSPSITPGSATSVSNSQCTLNGTGSSFSTSGTNFTLNVSLTFSGTFTGSKNVYLEAQGKTQNSGWLNKGTWTP